MRLLSMLVLIFVFFSTSVFAHQDTIILLKENGVLEGLPDKYKPATLDLKTMKFIISNVTFIIPECISKYFPANSKGITVTSSWYHQSIRSGLPPYISLNIAQQDKDSEYRFLFELDTIKPIKFTIDTRRNLGMVNNIPAFSYDSVELKISRACRNAISQSYEYN